MRDNLNEAANDVDPIQQTMRAIDMGSRVPLIRESASDMGWNGCDIMT
jgi:hypothetical protein